MGSLACDQISAIRSLLLHYRFLFRFSCVLTVSTISLFVVKTVFYDVSSI